MKITGKAKEDFWLWIWKYHYKEPYDFSDTPSSNHELTGFIVEWMDSAGIYIECNRATLGIEFKWWYYTISDSRGVHLNNHLHNIVKVDSRHEATQQAINKAIEIYNERI